MADTDMKTDAGEDVRELLDHGVVIAGEVQVKLFGMKVLPVKVNLVIATTQRAESLGLKWWPANPKRDKGESNRRPPKPSQANGLSVRRLRRDKRR